MGNIVELVITSSKKSGAVLWCTTVVTSLVTNTDDDHGQPYISCVDANSKQKQFNLFVMH